MTPGPFEIISRVQRSGRNALALYLLGLCITAGGGFVMGLVIGRRDDPVEAVLPGWLVAAWYLLLLTGGIVSVVGITLRDVVLSLLYERVGLTALTPAAAVYGVALIVQGHSIATGVTVELFALACLVRSLQIKVELRHIRTGQ